MQGRLLLPLLLCAAVGAYLIMHFWTLPALRAATGGLELFDLLLSGYTHDYVALYVTRLGDEARALYLGTHRLIDTGFAAALTAAVAVSGYQLARRWGFGVALVLAAVPLVYFAFDMLENAQVAAILARGAATEAMSAAASWYTQAKAWALWGAITLMMFAVSGRAFEAAFRGREER